MRHVLTWAIALFLFGFPGAASTGILGGTFGGQVASAGSVRPNRVRVKLTKTPRVRRHDLRKSNPKHRTSLASPPLKRTRASSESVLKLKESARRSPKDALGHSLDRVARRRANLARPTAAAGTAKPEDRPNLFSHGVSLAERRKIRALRAQIFEADNGSRLFESERVRRRHLSEQAADPHVRSVTQYSAKNGKIYQISDPHLLARAPSSETLSEDDGVLDDASLPRFIRHITSRSRERVTLAIQGDILELTKILPVDANDESVRSVISQIIESHPNFAKALVEAVTSRGLRVLWMSGNHDAQLTNPLMRAHFINEIFRVSGATAARKQRFKSRVAFTGHAAPFGAKLEAIATHGAAQDPVNNVRSQANPYVYRVNDSGKVVRVLENTVGAAVTRHNPVALSATGFLARAATMLLNPRVTLGLRRMVLDSFFKSDSEQGSIGSLAKGVFERGLALAKISRQVSKSLEAGQEVVDGDAEDATTQGEVSDRVADERAEQLQTSRLASRLDDRLVMRAWAKRHGLDKAFTADGEDVARTFEKLYALMPTPLHRIKSLRFPTLAFANGLKATAEGERIYLSAVTRLFPGLGFVFFGHTHNEQVIQARADGRDVVHSQTGQWGSDQNGPQLNVVIMSTNHSGAMTFDGLYRVDPSSGVPFNEAIKPSEKVRIPGWEARAGDESHEMPRHTTDAVRPNVESSKPKSKLEVSRRRFLAPSRAAKTPEASLALLSQAGAGNGRTSNAESPRTTER